MGLFERMDEQLQHQRFEKKYLVPSNRVAQVREWINSYLPPDEYSAGPPQHAYPVNSIYLDSYDLTTYWATVHCEKRRFKLRVRFYDENPESPVFFEVKRRENECIMKQRAIVHRSAAPSLLARALPGFEHLIKPAPYQLDALNNFYHLMKRIDAHPMMLICYKREAWLHPESNSVRVTIDSMVQGEPRSAPVFTTEMTRPVFPFGKEWYMLELKFTNRFPDWYKDMVEYFNLMQCGGPKYCGSVLLSGEDRVGHKALRVQQQQMLDEAMAK